MQQSLAELQGEHFLVVEAEQTVAAVLDRLRDHRCLAAVFPSEGQWRIFSALGLTELMLTGAEALQQPIASAATALPLLSPSAPPEALRQALQEQAWVGIGADQPVAVFHWGSWMRHSARNRLAQPYVFSPESGRSDAAAVKV